MEAILENAKQLVFQVRPKLGSHDELADFDGDFLAILVKLQRFAGLANDPRQVILRAILGSGSAQGGKIDDRRGRRHKGFGHGHGLSS
jgi:hypothetical protein